MDYRIAQDIPGRLRIAFTLPRFPAVEPCLVEAQFRDIAGVHKASFSPRTTTMLVLHGAKAQTRSAILALAAAAPIPRSRKPRPETELESKKKSAVNSVLLLLASPLIPPPIRPIMAMRGALPIFVKGL